MKKLKALKLNQLSKDGLEKREMSQLIGGEECCGCGCNGPSSAKDNGNANWDAGYSISAGGNIRCACWGDKFWSDNF